MSSKYSEYLNLYLYLQIWKSTCTWLKYFEKYLTPTLQPSIYLWGASISYSASYIVQPLYRLRKSHQTYKNCSIVTFQPSLDLRHYKMNLRL